MRIALFFIINIVTAVAVIVLSLMQDQSTGSIIWRVIGVLVAIQLLYVVWLVAVSVIRGRQKDTDAQKAAAHHANPTTTPANDA